MDVRKVMVEVDDRVAYDLAGAVVGDVAPAVDGEEFKTVLFELLLVHEKVFHFSALAQSENRRMLHKQKVICGFLSSFWMFSIGQF